MCQQYFNAPLLTAKCTEVPYYKSNTNLSGKNFVGKALRGAYIGYVSLSQAWPLCKHQSKSNLLIVYKSSII